MGILRRTAEVLSRRSRFRKRLPAEFGKRSIVVSAANQLSVYKPGRAGYDSILLRWAQELVSPGMTVWDVGANMGLFTFPAAARGARVRSFEPDAFNQDLLHASRSLNPDLDVRVIPAAASRVSGFATFNVSQRGRSANGLSHIEQGGDTGGVRQTYDVITVALDAMLEILDPPDLVKIDTEGAEVEVLEGAQRLLHDLRPNWIIEVAGANTEKIWTIMHAADYRCHDAGVPSFPLRESLANVFNALFIPAERDHSLAH